MSQAINNSEKRIEVLKSIIERLHRGTPPAEVKRELAAVVHEATAGEIGQMEQELIARGMKVEEVMKMCDLHHEVVLDILAKSDRNFPAGHPAEVLRRENARLTLLMADIRKTIAEIASSPFLQNDAVMRLRTFLDKLADLDKHYQRKEYVFFPRLEQHGIDGPSKVMWGKDDEVRAKLKAFISAIGTESGSAAGIAKAGAGHGEIALKAIEDMISKENNILIPMCLDVLTQEDWAAIWRDSPQYGWLLGEPGKEYQPAAVEGPLPAAAVSPDQGVDLGTGTLKLEQLKALFHGLPVDLTFVDAEDTVRFFSDGDRIFQRTTAILGRKVQHCHPPHSVDVVERILSDFRSGKHDIAEFWINFHEKFVHIRYFALRDDAGRYTGCLEVTQNLTPLRGLQGERRLLQYE